MIQQQKAKREVERQAGGWVIERQKCAADILYWFDRHVWTYDPRLTRERNPDGTRKSPYVPFRLWPKQREILLQIGELVDAGEEGLIEKSRDTGATYLTAGFALHRWLFVPGFKTTFGSRKVDYVDKRDNPDSIFAKLRIMLRRQPAELLPEGFNWSQHDNYMRIVNPATGSVISGEGGEDMGRGGRSSLYVVDEAAFVPNADTVENANTLFQAGNVRVIDILGRVSVVTDAPALYTAAAGGDPARRRVLSLVAGAATVTDSRDIISNIETSNGQTRIETTLQIDYTFGLGLKGYTWDEGNGGKSPTDAEIATGSNWDKVATDIKHTAGTLAVGLA